MKTIAIIQARLGSTRLPGKVLFEVAGRPLIGLLLERLSRCRTLDGIVLATGDGPENDALDRVVSSLGYPVVRGSEENVLARYAQAASVHGAEVIVRLTGDCPLMDPGIVDLLVRVRAERHLDFCTNVLPPTWPDGLDVAVFTREILDAAHREADRSSDREHVVPWMWRQTPLKGGDRFTAENVPAPEDLSRHRWTVDEASDYAFLRVLASEMGADRLLQADYRELLRVLESKPEIENVNREIVRDAGYAKSLTQEEAKNMKERSSTFSNSLALLERAKKAVPAQTQTFSKGWTQFPLGVSPVFLDHAEGGHVWDVDGHEFIDWPMGIGPLLLGHNHPAVNEAIRRQLERGICFSQPHVKELELAERLIAWFPYAERARFGKNGSDATAGAVRAARAVTRRDIILCCGYHGWQDWYIGTTTRNAGVPHAVRELTVPFPYDDLPALEAQFARYPDKVAAVIMEPMGVVEPGTGYLEGVKRLTKANGALLIFDECWTGFRLHLQGAFGKFGVAPDMACFGKALGNGVPISVIVGRAEVMDVFDEVFFSFTFGGDMLGIAAAHAVLDVLEREPVLERTGEVGTALLSGVRALIDRHHLKDRIGIQGYPQKTFMNFCGDGEDGLLIKSIYQQESIARGILAAGYHAPCLSHTKEDVAKTLDAYDHAFAVIAEGLAKGDLRGRLRGRQVQPVFRKH